MSYSEARQKCQDISSPAQLGIARPLNFARRQTVSPQLLSLFCQIYRVNHRFTFDFVSLSRRLALLVSDYISIMAVTRSNKRLRDESEEPHDEPQPKRTARTPEPATRRHQTAQTIRAPNTAPLPRNSRSQSLHNSLRTPTKQAWPGQARFARRPEYQKIEFSPIVTIMDSPPVEGNEENIRPVSRGSESSNDSHTSQVPVKQHQSTSLFGSVFSAAATPIKTFRAVSSWVRGSTAATEQRQPTTPATTSKVSTTPSTHRSSQTDDAEPVGLRRDQMNIFTGRPSPYAIPTSQAHLIPKLQARPLSQADYERRLVELQDDVYERAIGAGVASEEFKKEYEARKQAKANARKLPTVSAEEEGINSSRSGEKRKRVQSQRSPQYDEPGRYALDYNESELEESTNASESTGEMTSEQYDETLQETPPAKTRKTSAYQTPSRSAMKKAADFLGHNTQPKSAKSVSFNPHPVSSTAYYPPYLGHAGEYSGTLFADPKSQAFTSSSVGENSLSSLDPADAISPATRMNTDMNAMTGCEPIPYDPNYRDPYDPTFRPTPGRPRPGTFRVPDDEDEDPSWMEDGMDEEATTPTGPPASPRPGHATLPSPTASLATPTTSTVADPGVLADSSATRLNKIREQAEKYKPKNSSNLSHFSKTRSRSTSPPLSSSTITTNNAYAQPNIFAQTRHHNNDNEIDESQMPPFAPSPPHSPPGSPPRASNITPEEQALQDEADEWARNLPWPATTTPRRRRHQHRLHGAVRDRPLDGGRRRAESGFLRRAVQTVGGCGEDCVGTGG